MYKRIIGFFILAIVMFSCKQQASLFKIEGNVKNYKGNNLVLQVIGQEKPYKLSIDKKGNFIKEIDIKKPAYARLINNNGSLPIYVANNVSVDYKFDISNLKKMNYKLVQIKGKNIEENKMMLDYYSKQVYPKKEQVFPLNPTDFVAKMKEVNDYNMGVIDEFVKKSKNINKDFVKLFKYQIQITFAATFMYYPMYHSMICPKDTSKIPANFNLYVDLLPLNDLNVYNNVYRYKTYEISVWNQKFMAKLPNPQANPKEFLEGYVKLLKETNIKQQIKDDLGNNFLNQYLRAIPKEYRGNSVEEYKKVQKNPLYLKAVDKLK